MVLRVEGGNFWFARFFVLLQVQLGGGRIAEVVWGVLVLLALFEQRVPEPVLDHLHWEAGLPSHPDEGLLSGGVVDVKVGAEYLELVVGYPGPGPFALVGARVGNGLLLHE